MMLADYHNTEANCAWPSQRTLADDCEMPMRTVQWCLRSLEQQGFITTLQKGNQYQSTKYHLNFDFAGSQHREPASNGGAIIAGSESPQIYEPANSGDAKVAGESEDAISDMVNPQSRAGEPAISVGTNLKEPLLEPPNTYAPPETFSKGFGALKDISAYHPDPKRDSSLATWLEENQVLPDTFFRAVTALAADWARRKLTDPWLAVRKWSLNQMKWDEERGSPGRDGSRPTQSLHDKRTELERGASRGRPIQRI